MGFEALSFLNPWLLAGLLLLPVLWWLLRVTPPAPKLMRFPAVRLLFGLKADEQTSADAPWWLVLLRLLAVAAFITGFAHPVMHQGRAMQGNGPLILYVDNDWAAAPGWAAKKAALKSYLEIAEREDRPVLTVQTATLSPGDADSMAQRLAPAEALGWLEGLQPYPWPGERVRALKALNALQPAAAATVVWASNGLARAEDEGLSRQLQRHGSLTVLTPPLSDQPQTVAVARGASGNPVVTLERLSGAGAQKGTLRAKGGDGRILGRQTVAFDAGERVLQVPLELPSELANQVARLDLDGEAGAGTVYLLDSQWQRPAVGIVQRSAAGSEMTLLSESYYLDRALTPFADVSLAPLSILLRAEHQVLMLPDAVSITAEERDELASWVEGGGVLIRFAGPRVAAAGTADLLPVTLRQGGRARDGALQWDEPARLGGFSADGPFAGIPVPQDVVVSRQVLAEPAPDLAEKSWAHLTDGTPLVSGSRKGDGWLVLFHTSANAAWSDLALSGGFVRMLERLGSLADRRGMGDAVHAAPMPPYRGLDAYGVLGASLKTAEQFKPDAPQALSSRLPPGLYGDEQQFVAVNLADFVPELTPIAGLPQGSQTAVYETGEARDLQAWFLLLALALLLIDAWVSLVLRGQVGFKPRPAVFGWALALCLAGLTSAPHPASAQGRDAEDLALKATGGTAFAYMETGDNAVDTATLEGLRGLSFILNQRTAVEAADPIAVDPAHDPLAFFPFIYWPVTESQSALSQTAVERLNQYMEQGGTLLVDLRSPDTGMGEDRAWAQLNRMTRGLDLPPLIPVPQDHVLTKAFYLLQSFPGRWQGGDVWVEPGNLGTHDSVSRLIVGRNDWVGAWAMDEYGRPRYPVVPGGERQRELAYRFGVNLVMYMLTGNYKADQVHIPAILERLGQ